MLLPSHNFLITFIWEEWGNTCKHMKSHHNHFKEVERIAISHVNKNKTSTILKSKQVTLIQDFSYLYMLKCFVNLQEGKTIAKLWLWNNPP